MNNCEIILFDLDGTLTDPKVGITKSVQYALSKLGVFEEDLDKLEPFIGPPLTSSFKEFYSFDDEKISKAIGFYREYFAVTGLYENKVYDGIEDMMMKLKNRGKKLVVATSKPTIFSEEILKHFNIYDYFDMVTGSELDGSRVLKEDVIKFVLSQFELPKSSFMMVGDRKFDIFGAKNCGIGSVAVQYGYGPEEELMKANPDYMVKTVQELDKLLCSL